MRTLIGRISNCCKVIQTTTITINAQRESYWLPTRRLDQCINFNFGHCCVSFFDVLARGFSFWLVVPRSNGLDFATGVISREADVMINIYKSLVRPNLETNYSCYSSNILKENN